MEKYRASTGFTRPMTMSRTVTREGGGGERGGEGDGKKRVG